MTKSNRFENEGYTLYILGKHIEVTDALRNYVWEKLSRVERIADHIIDVHVVLDAQKLEKTCSILMNFIRFQIKVQVGKDNMYEAIDKAIDRVVKLVRRYKTKLQSYRNKDLSTVDIHVNVIQPLSDNLKAINEDIEAENAKAEAERYSLHKVVAKETMPLKTLTHDEAIMKMEITSDPFLIFKSEEDQKIKVIYRREDENYGLVQVSHP